MKEKERGRGKEHLRSLKPLKRSLIITQNNEKRKSRMRSNKHKITKGGDERERILLFSVLGKEKVSLIEGEGGK